MLAETGMESYGSPLSVGYWTDLVQDVQSIVNDLNGFSIIENVRTAEHKLRAAKTAFREAKKTKASSEVERAEKRTLVEEHSRSVQLLEAQLDARKEEKETSLPVVNTEAEKEFLHSAAGVITAVIDIAAKLAQSQSNSGSLSMIKKRSKAMDVGEQRAVVKTIATPLLANSFWYRGYEVEEEVTKADGSTETQVVQKTERNIRLSLYAAAIALSDEQDPSNPKLESVLDRIEFGRDALLDTGMEFVDATSPKAEEKPNGESKTAPVVAEPEMVA